MLDFFTDPVVTLLLGVCLGVLLALAAVQVAERIDRKAGR